MKSKPLIKGYLKRWNLACCNKYTQENDKTVCMHQHSPERRSKIMKLACVSLIRGVHGLKWQKCIFRSSQRTANFCPKLCTTCQGPECGVKNVQLAGEEEVFFNLFIYFLKCCVGQLRGRRQKRKKKKKKRSDTTSVWYCCQLQHPVI